jgi:homoserine kinase
MKKFTVKVPATTANLGPGYDTLGMALEIFNEFEVTFFEEKKLIIEVEGEGKGRIPEDERNLTYKAVKKGFEIAREEIPGLHIRQVNRVPLARGMGSSATAILGGFLIVKHIVDNFLSWDELIQEAVKLEGHPDNIMAAYKGGIVLNYLEGDKYKAVNFAPKQPLRAALAIPDIEINTKEARGLLPENYPLEDVVSNMRSISLLIYALQEGKYNLLFSAMNDRIHQPYRAKLIPGFYEAVEKAYEAGAWGAVISGSGSTVLALCSSYEEEIAKAMKSVFDKQNVKCRTMTSFISRQGAEIIS